MFFPKLQNVHRHIKTNQVFGGYVHNKNVGEHSFYDCENLSSDSYPLLSTRKRHGMWYGALYDEDQNITGFDSIRFVAGKGYTAAANIGDKICLCTGLNVILDGKTVSGVSLDKNAENRSLVAFGKNFFVAPDGYYVSLGESGQTGVSNMFCPQSLSGETLFTRCGKDGEASGSLNFVKISNPNLSCKNFYIGDEIKISCESNNSLNGIFSISAVSQGFIVIDFTLSSNITVSGNISIEKIAPILDFAVENNNRIWGCRYGKNKKGEFVNEIYASKLGDPTRWNCFDGISTDSYTVSLGCSGEFTGVSKLGNSICFFKEDYIITVQGDSPSDFSVSVFRGRGIEKGSHRSCVNLNEKLFYKSFDGITVFDGTVPYGISEEFGTERYSNATAGAVDGKYYVSMKHSSGDIVMFVYDTKTGLWNKESVGGTPEFFVYRRNCLYTVNCIYTFPPNVMSVKIYNFHIHCIDTADDACSLFYDENYDNYDYKYAPEENLRWFAQTGSMGAENGSSMILRSMIIRLKLGKGSSFALDVQCDNRDDWLRVCNIDSLNSETFSVPVNMPRCDSYKLKFSGEGECTVYSVSGVFEKTNEVNIYGR